MRSAIGVIRTPSNILHYHWNKISLFSSKSFKSSKLLCRLVDLLASLDLQPPHRNKHLKPEQHKGKLKQLMFQQLTPMMSPARPSLSSMQSSCSSLHIPCSCSRISVLPNKEATHETCLKSFTISSGQ